MYVCMLLKICMPLNNSVCFAVAIGQMDISADIRYPRVTDVGMFCYPLRIMGMGSGMVFRLWVWISRVNIRG
jgi:hypothetical protein